jgi:hypothetical protein
MRDTLRQTFRTGTLRCTDTTGMAGIRSTDIVGFLCRAAGSPVRMLCPDHRAIRPQRDHEKPFSAVLEWDRRHVIKVRCK